MTFLRLSYSAEEQENLDVYRLEFHPEMLFALHELGVIEIQEGRLSPDQLRRVYRIMRLKNCLGVNLPGAAIILELLDRIEELQDEIERLKKAR
ncbi:MAG: chaperone modulator CbpM [Desulfotomaculales bacterium]